MPVPNREDRRHDFENEPHHNDQRLTSERDRDRVLYSTAFRRLAGVTQVVHTAEGHVFHNRLTHSIKVAQVAKRIAEYLRNTEEPEIQDTVGKIDANVVEAAALIHDLGHPPFGHIGEQELEKILVAHGIADGYEGNAQSFRIITKLTIRNSKYLGLNLSRATLDASLKYPWARAENGKKAEKWGYYVSEADDFGFAHKLAAKGDKQSAEAAIMDWADDVTYAVHDVEDFYRAGLLPLDRLLYPTSQREQFLMTVYARWEKQGHHKRIKDLPKEAASDFLNELLILSGADALDSPFNGTRQQQIALGSFASYLIRRYVRGHDKNPQAEGDETRALKLDPSGEPSFIHVLPRFRAEVDLLKALMQRYVYNNPALLTQQYGQRKVIRDLFEIYCEAWDPANRNFRGLPNPFVEYWESATTDLPQPERLAADLIASLTEQQSLALHQRLLGIAPGSIHNTIIS
ncbi:MAG TPA: dNTP triphosphohydrolase [Chloroflexia bacterium]|nr:dNTP triphosphohydrolase [Chloroflexia bacterium]